MAVLFGSLYTIFRKYQTIVDLPQAETFNQPLYFPSYSQSPKFYHFCGDVDDPFIPTVDEET